MTIVEDWSPEPFMQVPEFMVERWKEYMPPEVISIFGGLASGIVAGELGHRIVDNPDLLLGRYFEHNVENLADAFTHHDGIGLIIILVTLVLYFLDYIRLQVFLFFFSFGVGLIVQHALTEGLSFVQAIKKEEVFT